MVNIEIIIGIIAIAVVLAIFAPLMFDPRGQIEVISCDEDQIITFDDQGNPICDDVVITGTGASFSNENSEFRPHLVQGTNVQDPIINFDDYQIRVLEYLPSNDGQTSWDYLVPEEYESGEDLQWTLYWFKEDGLTDFSVVPHYYEEVTSCGETSTETTILNIQDGVEFDFEENETYLLMANTMWGGTDVDDLYQVSVRHGDTIFDGSHLISEPQQAGTSPCNPNEDVYKYFWWTLYTPNATEALEDISIHVKSGLGVEGNQQFIQTTTDDAEQLVISPFTMALTTTDMDLHDEGAPFDGHASWRYQNLPIPQGATIINATIQFEVEQIDDGQIDHDPLTVDFTGHDIDNSLAHTTTLSDISDRVQTSANVTWNVPDWVAVDDRGSAQLTPDLKTIVQEIVDRAGWVSGNDMSIMLIDPPDDQGHRHADADSDNNAGELTINYIGVPPSSPMLFDDVTFTVIKLSDHFTEGTDYFFNLNATESALDDVPNWATSNDASITFTPENNNDEWLVLGTANYNEGSVGFEQIMTRLQVAGVQTDLPEISRETQDTDERQVHTFARPIVFTNTTQTLEVESQIDNTRTTENRTSSAIFALNLDLFRVHEATWIEADLLIDDSDFNIEWAELTFNPNADDKNTVIIADVGYTSDIIDHVEVRVQVDNSDTLPDQTSSSYDFQEIRSITDVERWALVTVENLDNSTHTIEGDISVEDEGEALYRTLVAFNLEALTPASPTPKTVCMFLELMSVSVGEDLSSLVVPTFGAKKEECVTTAGGADILRTFTWNFNTTEIPFTAEEVGIVKLSRMTNNTNEDFTGTVFGLFGELQWVFDP